MSKIMESYVGTCKTCGMRTRIVVWSWPPNITQGCGCPWTNSDGEQPFVDRKPPLPRRRPFWSRMFG